MIVVVFQTVEFLQLRKPRTINVRNTVRAENQCGECPIRKLVNVGVVFDCRSQRTSILIGYSRFSFVLHSVSFPPEARCGRTQKEPVVEDDHRL